MRHGFVMIAAVAAFGVGVAATPAAALVVNWGEGSNGAQTAGNFLWSDAGNWTGDYVPTFNYPGDDANIGETTGDRTLTTPATSWQIYTLDVVQSPTRAACVSS